MTLTLAGKNVAILAANGFDENQMTEIQRALTKAKAVMRTVAPETGVVNGWQGEGWGHYFPVDAQINEALGSDFDILVLPGGERAIAKLKTNPHTKRIISHFMDAGKPIAAIGAGVSLLTLSDAITDRTVAAPLELQAEMRAANAITSEDPQEVDGNLLTADGTNITAWVEEAMEFFGDAELLSQAA
ncbi:MAG TPA: DJ-1/PfpI family protein [Alphaproteobacteria bacterium]|nr:DJ-1/PfpI family protein [Alphaproteobacteria bacterium]